MMQRRKEIVMRIITNTASIITPEEGKELGIEIIPVSVSINGRSLRDFIDIDSNGFVKLLKGDKMPQSSQPAVGDVINALEDAQEDIIMLTVADGLSGEYKTAMGVKNYVEGGQFVHVINSGTLGAALRYMAVKAARLRNSGASIEEVLADIERCVESSASFVIPADFEYLKKSGRITNLTSKLGGALRLLPVLTQTEDRQRIVPIRVRRTWKTAVMVIIDRLKKMNVDRNYLISIEYADTLELAIQVEKQIGRAFSDTETEIRQLPPSLITHGGPGCIVVQAIRR